jgi:DNA-binding CsgD family transcriptional regulator
MAVASRCRSRSSPRRRSASELAVEAREALRALAGLRWRRRRVLALKAAGDRYEEIAEMLGVTYTNVNRHLTNRSPAREAATASSLKTKVTVSCLIDWVLTTSITRPVSRSRPGPSAGRR